jgi:hypothetical protein
MRIRFSLYGTIEDISELRQNCLFFGQASPVLSTNADAVFSFLPGDGASPISFNFSKQGKIWACSGVATIDCARDGCLFLARYLCVIGVLDSAAARGMTVAVSDDGGFWQGRNVEALMRFKQATDSLVK